MNLKSAKAGLTYFLFVFAAGFVLGVLRVTILVPRLGAGTSELIELPFMVLMSYLTARFVVRRFVIETMVERFLTGAFALGLLVLAELTLVLGIQGLTIAEYIGSRNPFSFAAYLVSLLIFALMPALVGMGANRDEGDFGK